MDSERERWKKQLTDCEALKKQLTEWQREAELLAGERDSALVELKSERAKLVRVREERDSFKASAEAAAKASAKASARASSKESARASSKEPPKTSAAETPPKAESLASPRGIDDLYAEIDAAMKKLREVPADSRASELRTLKRSYHPDAQRVKSQAVQQLFTQLSQHVNGFCEAHLRRDCRVCGLSTRGTI